MSLDRRTLPFTYKELEEAPATPEPLPKSWSVRHLLRLRVDRCVIRHLIFPSAVELADGIRLHLPSLERHGDLALAFAELLLEGAAHQRTLDVDVIAFPQLR